MILSEHVIASVWQAGQMAAEKLDRHWQDARVEPCLTFADLLGMLTRGH